MATEPEDRPESAQDSPELASIKADLAYREALSLAASGQYDAAEQCILGAGSLCSSPQAKDLLARLAVHKGDFASAEQLWSELAAEAPQFEPGKRALGALRSGWLGRAVLRRVVYLAGIAGVLLLAVIGVFALVSHSTTSCMVRPECMTAALRSSATSGNASQTVVPPGSPLPPTESSVPSPEPPISLSVPGCTVVTNQNELTVLFPYGLFSSRCAFRDGAPSLVREAARALKTVPADLLVVVEGHTDAVPLPDASKSGNHYYLGYCRAIAVADILLAEHPVPSCNIVLSSAGADNPPFMGTDAAARANNRTVVLRIRQRTAPQPPPAAPSQP